MRALITVIAFAGKEIRQVLRQPRLMTALILGPFVILGLFAVGFRSAVESLDTIVVVPESSTLEIDVDAVNEELGGRLDIVDVVPDQESAVDRLADGSIDLIVVIPADAEEVIRAGDPATVTVLHNRLDPFDRAAISATAQAAVSDFNRSLLATVASAAQDRSRSFDEPLSRARSSTEALAAALEDSDAVSAATARDEAVEAVTTMEEGVAEASWFSRLLVGNEAEESIDTHLSSARSALDAMESAPTAEDAAKLDRSLAGLEKAVATFRAVPPEVLVRPFVTDTRAISGVDIPTTKYFSPAVVLVLLQHVVLTFAALSLVNERSLGTTELFRVGPTTTTELLLGKVLGYAVLGSLVGSILVVVVVFGFGTTMVGSWWWLAAVLALTIVASLGLGFLIAAAAMTDAQAVQYAMLALLFTIFFGGLVVSLDRLTPFVRQVAFVAPATAGTGALHDVMFRGEAPRTGLLLVLGAYAVVSFAGARWWLGRRQVA